MIRRTNFASSYSRTTKIDVVPECLWRGARFGFPQESKAKLVPQTLTDG